MVNKDILPAAINYKHFLAHAINEQKQAGVEAKTDREILALINHSTDELRSKTLDLQQAIESIGGGEDLAAANKIAKELLPLSEEIADHIAVLEENISEELWPLPTYYDLLFIR